MFRGKIAQTSGTFFDYLVDWLSEPNQKIIWTEPKMAKSHDISVYFSTNAILALWKAAP